MKLADAQLRLKLCAQFRQLACQQVALAESGRFFTARKLPQPRQKSFARPLSQQNFSFLSDDGQRPLDVFGEAGFGNAKGLYSLTLGACRAVSGNGTARQCGFLVMQMVAPSSIKP